MQLNILADAEWQSGIGRVLIWFSKTEYWDIFEKTDYGAGLDKVAIFLICRDPGLNFKRRIRHSRKDKTIYMDVMLNLPDFIGVSFEERRKMVLKSLLTEVPAVVGKYKIADFDVKSFLADFNEKFSSLKAAIDA